MINEKLPAINRNSAFIKQCGKNSFSQLFGHYHDRIIRFKLRHLTKHIEGVATSVSSKVWVGGNKIGNIRNFSECFFILVRNISYEGKKEMLCNL